MVLELESLGVVDESGAEPGPARLAALRRRPRY